jgi:ATP-dependent RNA helicase RhlE
MERFRRHKIPVLVATDLASRGIDVSAISHIINYDVPQDPHIYVHRIGRTARMGAFGKAITLASREQGPELTEIEKLINKELQPLQFDGFEASPPPREEAFGPVQPVGSAVGMDGPAAAPVSTAAAAVPAMPQTLGGKFPVSRRFRRRR